MQTVIQTPVEHDGYPKSHEPPCATRGSCDGCNEMRSRRQRNFRAGKVVGVFVRGSSAQQPSGTCAGCKAPAYAGAAGTALIWAWNHNVDRASWAVEPRGKNIAHPKSLCPRCRPATT